MSRYFRSTAIAEVELDGRFFVSGPSGEVLVLEDNAAVIWECIDGSELANIVQRVAARVGLPDTAIADDTRAFLESLSQAGLLIAD